MDRIHRLGFADRSMYVMVERFGFRVSDFGSQVPGFVLEDVIHTRRVPAFQNVTRGKEIGR